VRPVTDEKPAPPPCAFGAEISESRQRCAVGKAYRGDDGRVTVEVVFYDSPAGAPAFIAGRFAEDDPVAVALDPKSQSATLLRPLAELGVLVTRLSAEDVAVAHGEFTDLVAANGLRHLNQEELTAAVRGAQQRALAGAQAWERRVQVDQCPLNACTFAAWALLRYEELSSPGAWTL
jgi:hypothetical protein